MNNDRDIDDILESLNELLREGESHNDDHTESETEEIPSHEAGLENRPDSVADENAHKVVLTEEMLVDNPQGNLLQLLHERLEIHAPDQQSDNAEEIESTPGDDEGGDGRWNEEKFNLLVERVTGELIERLNREVPVWVSESMKRHIEELKRDE